MLQGGPFIKPTHRAIKTYYDTLSQYATQDVSHETALRSAFQNLLGDTAKNRGWTLVPELAMRSAAKTGRGQSRVVPDGTVKDNMALVRGYWEAKDTEDNLDAEIVKKIRAGYPLTNIVFEDTRQGVLYQNGVESLRVDLRSPAQLAELLNTFFTHEEPDIEQFERAVDEFKERVPELALGLTEKIRNAHTNNRNFIAAFADFFKLCQTALNPNISQAAVDEMLVQHLLTERLFRTIFDNSDFVHQNVIAAEVEKVIAALASKSFSRHEFLKSLDRFYVAIEDAARGLDDFSEKQQFLNTVYERFFQGYSVKIADTHGIVYTPQPIVDFMCASIAEILEKEFGMPLGSPDVHFLDPCTGTGNFIVNLLNRIPKKDLPHMFRQQLFANEVMLLPYYIAAMNIEHAYYTLTGEYEPFEGLCFVDTLDIEHKGQLTIVTQENTARVNREKGAPITVIFGNPPYNVGQLNENDNNKNRRYQTVDGRIALTYAKDSNATLNNKLYDPYVKFFRWAIDRLGERDGIVCFVSNNSFVENTAFDSMRRHLMRDFTRLYHIDLHGNVRKNPKLSGSTHNVFGIQVGVGITLGVRRKDHLEKKLFHCRVPEMWRKEEKFEWLHSSGSISRVKWQELIPSADATWLIPKGADQFASFMAMGTKLTKANKSESIGCIFKLYSLGVVTNRDIHVYNFQSENLCGMVKTFVEIYNSAVDTLKSRPAEVDPQSLILTDDPRIKWTRQVKQSLIRCSYSTFDESHIRRSLYRPFASKLLYFDNFWNEELYQQRAIFPLPFTERENRVIVVPAIACERDFYTLVTSMLPNLNFVGFGGAGQCFPFYVYDEDGANRRENITDWALSQFQTRYESGQSKIQNLKSKIDKWAIFYYVYGLLHHPGYRAKYADNLKRELPRLPFAPDFWAFSDAGRELAHWHLDYEKVEPYPLTFVTADGIPLSYRVEDKMRLTKDKTALIVNPSLTLSLIPPEAFNYRLGNRSALEWVIDQYQVKHDPRSNITSNPNRQDDPEYIVRLVGQVMRVSLETVRTVKGLPEEFEPFPEIGEGTTV